MLLLMLDDDAYTDVAADDADADDDDADGDDDEDDDDAYAHTRLAIHRLHARAPLREIPIDCISATAMPYEEAQCQAYGCEVYFVVLA